MTTMYRTETYWLIVRKVDGHSIAVCDSRAGAESLLLDFTRPERHEIIEVSPVCDQIIAEDITASC